ncbi:MULTISPECIES: glycosyltransferase [unclassified Bradyrhizobium]|uniref:glycosyltransferase n=1 Tax=unclassified Bradyrhizobium TaxID=2631580 RepID=UPI0028E5F1EA|nr:MULTISPECIES: nucleotide disphospho-sugar-binding domain-containing protein [unclassified Bradyrhizobium]
MARFLIAVTALPGHVFPLLAVAQLLVGRGHEVVVYSGSLFRERVEATGARFVAFRPEIDVDYRKLDERFPERRKFAPGPAQLCFGLKHIFADAMPHQAAGIRELRRDFPFDAIITDTMFCGTFPLVLGPPEKRAPIVALGITALALSSADTAFFGTALPPSITPADRARNAAMNSHLQQAIFGSVQQYFNDVLVKNGARPLPAFLFDSMITLPDLYLQLTAKEFEYSRGKMPDSIRFVGPLLPPPSIGFHPPPWWDDVDKAGPIVLVTQGTLANGDLGQLVGPTLTALANEELTVIACTGGPPVESIPVVLQPNAKAVTFLPFDRLLPKVSVMVTNGGYGAVNHALSLGVPLVVAGDSEEKPEIAARVAWAGAGINLGTGRPSVSQIREAVRAVLTKPQYRRGAQALRTAFVRHNARDEIAELVERLAAGGSSASSQGNPRHRFDPVGTPAEAASRRTIDVDAGLIRGTLGTV